MTRHCNPKNSNTMTAIFKKLSLAAALAMTAATVAPEAKAANVTLDGYGQYFLGNTVKYYGGGVKQGGRYKNLGADYYTKATIKMDFITNRSNAGSGSLSFEFWAMPYKGATTGIILMTKGLDPLPGRKSYNYVSAKGYAINLDRRRFPELNLWEFTRNGWKFRDVLSFPRKVWL